MEERTSRRRGILWASKDILQLSKIYLGTAMAKFPLVISKNGILTSAVAIILLGGVLSGMSNMILTILSQKTNERSYLAISKKTVGKKIHSYVKLTAFLLRCLGICYSVDLSFRFLQNLIIPFMDHSQILFLLGVCFFCSVALLPESENFALGRSRNFVNFLVLGLLTAIFSLKKFRSTINQICIKNPSKNHFDSLGLTCICFAQQLGVMETFSSVHFQRKARPFYASVLASLFYVSIGISGYISAPKPAVNWLSNIQNWPIRFLSSLILLLSNIASFPIQLKPIRKELEKLFFSGESGPKEFFLNFLLTVLFMLLSLSFVATPYAAVCCVILSSLITMIFPSIFYLKIFKRNKPLSSLVLTTGILVFTIGLRDLMMILLDDFTGRF